MLNKQVDQLVENLSVRTNSVNYTWNGDWLCIKREERTRCKGNVCIREVKGENKNSQNSRATRDLVYSFSFIPELLLILVRRENLILLFNRSFIFTSFLFYLSYTLV